MANDNPRVIADCIRIGLKAHQLLGDDLDPVIGKVGPDTTQAWVQALKQVVEMGRVLSADRDTWFHL